MKALLRRGENPKAEAELSILKALAKGCGLSALAKDWSVSASALSGMTNEIRRELARAPQTRRRYAELCEKIQGDAQFLAGSKRKLLNAKLLPLYRVFRRDASPSRNVSARICALAGAERRRRVLQSRSSTFRIGSNGPGPSVHEAVSRDSRDIPPELPLPPFTKAQRAFMKRVRYVPVASW